MLRALTIHNFVIVESLELEFGGGFSALTGETGAGKSILIDALSLALGERADVSVIRAGSERAEVSAEFDLSTSSPAHAWLREQGLDGENTMQCLLRRTVDSGGRAEGDASANATRAGAVASATRSEAVANATRSGAVASPTRSRAFINGTPVTVQQLRALSELLIDIHGQHAHQSLLRAEAQRDLLDQYGALNEQVQQVGERYRAWQALHKARVTFETNAAAFAAERAQLEEQVRELDALAFTPESWRELQDEHKRLAHAASLLEGASAAHDALAEGEAAILAQSNAITARLRELREYDAALDDIVTLLESADVQLREATHALRRYRDRLDLDPQRLQEIDARLDAVHRAARKYRVNAEALTELLTDARARLAELGAVASVDELRQKENAAERDYAKLAEKLSSERHRIAKDLSAKVTESLQSLAMAGARFEIALTPLPAASAHGLEQVEFQVSSHQGLPLGAIGKIASGGELSRISLAIQVVLAKVAAVPTLIFDEVDSGIGGRVAEIVGRMLKQLGRDRQVLCVTHLPQVAACADHQFSVAKKESKGTVTSSITTLDRPARIEEIARMLGGVKITDTTRQHAAELLSGASKGRK